MRRILGILGTPIDDLDSAQAIQRLVEFVDSGRFHQVATANTDFLVKALHDPELAHILRQADLVVPDGMPVVLASKLLGAPLKERVTGADLVPALASEAARRGWRIYMLGAKPEVAAAAKTKMERDIPGVQIVGCFSPPLASIVEMENAGILSDIEEKAPHILLVAFGNPKQEKWIYMHRHHLKVPVCIGIGGTFDFISGNIARAPQWVQTIGMEWLYRLCQEPKRLWKRYTQDFWHFGRYFALQWWTGRPIGGQKARIATSSIGNVEVISILGALTDELNDTFQRCADSALNEGNTVVLDFADCKRVDVAAMGTLINLPKRAAHVGKDVLLVRPNQSVLRALKHASILSLYSVQTSMAEAMSLASGRPFAMNMTENARSVVITLMGRADINGATQLDTHLHSVKADTQVVMDTRDVDYVDSAMLAVLRRQADRLGAGGGRLELVLGNALRNKMVLENLMTRFHIIDNFDSEPIGSAQAEPARRVA